MSSKLSVNLNVRFVLLVSFLVVYLCIGGAVFSAIEGPIEKESRDELLSYVGNFMSQHECLTYSDLNEFMKKITREDARGVSAVDNGTKPLNWNFAPALFFSATVITTIGYGTASPLSNYGKAFCVIYALVGLPLTLLVIGASVERLSVLTNHFLKLLNSILSNKWKALSIQLLYLFMLGMIVLIFFYLIPAAIFYSMESEWSYFDAIYFCFISLTTIGLGDYTPANQWENYPKYRNLYLVAITGYLILGLISMILLVELMVQIPQLNASLLFMIPKTGMDEENGENDRLTNSGDRVAGMYTLNTSINQTPADNEKYPLTQSDAK